MKDFVKDPAAPQSSESPRSIDRKETIGMTSLPSQSPQNNNMLPVATIKVRRPEHRRTNSDPRYYQQQQQQMPVGPPSPYGMVHPPPSPRSQQVAAQPSGQQQRRTPPPGYQQQRRSHNRTRSWNPPPEMLAQGLSPAGNPLIPVLQDPGIGDPNASYASSSGRRKRSHNSGNGGGGRARSHSASGASPYSIYGEISPPPTPSGPPHQGHNAGSWSPRGEIMKLTKGYSNRGNGNARTTPPMSPDKGSSVYRSMSPRASSPSSFRTGYGATRGNGHPNQFNPNTHVQFSSGTAMDHPFSATASVCGMQPWQHDFDGDSPVNETDGLLGRKIKNAGGGGGGEPVFDAQRRSISQKRNGSGAKKMHMRQRSAQLFMEDVKGSPQPPACRDVLFVLLFLFHLVGMLFLGTMYGLEAMKIHEDHKLIANSTAAFNLNADEDAEAAAVTLKYWNIIYLACLCGGFAVVVSTCALLVMMTITKRIIQLALILTICLSFMWGTIGIGLSPKSFVPVTGIIALALSVAYAFVVWDRIPFAASNLHSGLSAVRANIGTVIVAFFFQGLALLWTLYYTFVVIGVYDALEVGDLVLSQNMQIFVYAMLGISYYWTFHVLMNIIQVTVAGTIGTWWFKPEGTSEQTFWNKSVRHALFSALFYSSGSICFGSLLIGPVCLIRQLSAFFRPAQEDSILMCLHECVNCVQQCIANCVDNLSGHFNPWALTYVGLYGYGLLDAGHNATELFEKRGWTAIVSDDLVTNVLLLFSVVVGGVTGCFGVLIQSIDKLGLTSFHEPTITAFSIGLGIGLVLTLVLFAIVSSSVNAAIVCFAGSPLEFESNHPTLSADMRSAWREVWPGCMDVVDMRVDIMTGGPHPLL